MSAPVLLHTKAELAAARPGLPAPVVLVPTMGALHAGHRALLRAARARAGPDSAAGSVIVSIFVNPLQFRPGEDLDRYPRTLEADLAMCAEEGVRAVFAPSAAEVYPGGQPEVTVDPGPMGRVFEGEFRPGFFDGVLTVVLKLFHLIRPDVAVFGEKDAQQLALVRRLVSDTDLGLAIEPVPTVRDADGLATSSRNRYLSAADRALALALPRALRAGATAAAAGDAQSAAEDAPGDGPMRPEMGEDAPGDGPEDAPGDAQRPTPPPCWPSCRRSCAPSPPWPSTTSRWSIRVRSLRPGPAMPGPR